MKVEVIRKYRHSMKFVVKMSLRIYVYHNKYRNCCYLHECLKSSSKNSIFTPSDGKCKKKSLITLKKTDAYDF